ncbi:MAG TPA: integrase [bacterium]|nr:integrase [bacterium]
MKKGENSNAPKKGTSTKVDPIKNPEDIERIRYKLRYKYRNICLFTLGINTNLRASDLCNLKIEQVRGLSPMDEIVIKEKKTNKVRRINLNSSCIKVINRHLRDNYDEYLFTGQRGPIKPSAVHSLVKGWCKDIGLRGNYGSHTLRKTWGYQQRVQFKTPLPLLMRCFNHASEKETLEYLCVQPEEIRAVYENEI